VDESVIADLLSAGRLESPVDQAISIGGDGPVFSNHYRVDEAAAVAVALTGAASAQLWRLRTGERQTVAVDVHSAAAATASFMFDRINGQPPPRLANVTTDFYECRGGDWIHLHGGLPHLHEGTLALLGCQDDRDQVATAVRRRDALELEEELAAAGMCGARARTVEEWQRHPHGAVVSNAPAVEIIKLADGEPVGLGAAARPLSDVRVLEFARILAAPVCGRTLAEHGADVLHVSSEKCLDLFSTEVNTTHGKRFCSLDLDESGDLAQARELARSADVFIDGYRAGSLERRGFDPHLLAEANPGIVYVSINCYGHEGPWRERRGWEQMAQSTSGLAMAQGDGSRPLKMPALRPGYTGLGTAPNDYVTGFLGAYGAMMALARRAREGGSWWVRVSLCQTAAWFERCGQVTNPESAPGLGDVAGLLTTSPTRLGELTHLTPVIRLGATPAAWSWAAMARDEEAPRWLAGSEG
jgi:crotonobetainyl-CoA:carnitine CoA-transferase CaiB-like acyl-CoA transferase